MKAKSNSCLAGTTIVCVRKDMRVGLKVGCRAGRLIFGSSDCICWITKLCLVTVFKDRWIVKKFPNAKHYCHKLIIQTSLEQTVSR